MIMNNNLFVRHNYICRGVGSASFSVAYTRTVQAWLPLGGGGTSSIVIIKHLDL
jgi:hypothetical protein